MQPGKCESGSARKTHWSWYRKLCQANRASGALPGPGRRRAGHPISKWAEGRVPDSDLRVFGARERVVDSPGIRTYRQMAGGEEIDEPTMNEPTMNDLRMKKLPMKKLAVKLIVFVALSVPLFARAISDRTPAKVDFRRDVQPIFKTS